MYTKSKNLLSKNSISKFSIDVENINKIGFTWDVFINLIPWPFRRFICTGKQDRIAETARYTGKSWLFALDKLFRLITFNDENSIVGRYDFSTHKNTTWVQFQKVANLLEQEFDIQIGPENINGLKWIMTKDEGYILWNKRKIQFESIGKFKDSTLGMEFVVGGLGGIWVDEASKQPKESTTEDIGKLIYDNADTILGSAVRSEYSGFNESIPEFETEVPFVNDDGFYVLDLNGKEFPVWDEENRKLIQVKFKTEKIYYFKTTHLDFSLNGWDPENMLHEKYFEDLWELSFEIKQQMLNLNSAYYEDTDLDCALIRATSWMAKACGIMSSRTEMHLRNVMIKNPGKAEGIVLGYIAEDDNLSLFTYRPHMDNTNIFNLKECLTDKQTILIDNKDYIIRHLTFGLDWGFSKIKAKNSAITVEGYSDWNNEHKAYEYTFALGDWHAITKSNKVDSEEIKIINAAKFIYDTFTKWKRYLHYLPIVWYDLQDKVTAWQVQKELERLGLKLKFLPGAKHAQKKWDRSDRQAWMQQMLASKRYFIDPRISSLLYKELIQSRLAKGSLQADKNSRDDAITALGYSRTMTRYHVKKSLLF